MAATLPSVRALVVCPAVCEKAQVGSCSVNNSVFSCRSLGRKSPLTLSGLSRSKSFALAAVPLLTSHSPGRRKNVEFSWDEEGMPVVSEGELVRIASLREFGDPKSLSEAVEDMAVDPLFSMSVLELLVANVQAGVQIEDFEVFSGRMAMMIFFSAVLLESVTGHGVFSSVNAESLISVAFIAVAGAAGTAFLAMGARSQEVAAFLAVGCKELVTSAVDNLIDGVFFESSPSNPEPSRVSNRN